jgi:hypothetical protein
VNVICSCGLPAHCCQPTVAVGVIYADLRSELNTPWPLQALFTQSSPVRKPLLQAFPFPCTLGEMTQHPLSQDCMFIYSSHGNWVFPHLQWTFPPTATFTSFPTPDCWACATAPAFSGRLVYLQLMWEVVFLPLLWSFPPSATFTSFLTPGFWVFAAAPAFSSRLVRDLPSPPLWCSGHPLCYMFLLLLLLLIIQFLFFSLVGVSLSRGLC